MTLSDETMTIRVFPARTLGSLAFSAATAAKGSVPWPRETKKPQKSYTLRGKECPVIK
jgi:hypothetical protein